MLSSSQPLFNDQGPSLVNCTTIVLFRGAQVYQMFCMFCMLKDHMSVSDPFFILTLLQEFAGERRNYHTPSLAHGGEIPYLTLLYTSNLTFCDFCAIVINRC